MSVINRILASSWKVPVALAVFLAGCDNAADKNKSSANKTTGSNTSQQATNIHPDLLKLRSQMLDYPLLQFLDKLEVLRETNDPSFNELYVQMLIKERLAPEVFPVLWEKMFSGTPDEVIVAGYSELGEFGLSDDWGRGLKLVLRKQVGKYNISTILFLDYNPKTKKLEFPEDLYYKRYPEYVPDAMRILIEYDKDIALGDVFHTRGKLLADRVQSKVIGISIAAKVDPSSKAVLDLDILPTVDEKDSVLKDQKDREMTSLVDVWSCTHCHAGGYGFLHEFPFDSQLHVHEHGDSARTAFKDVLVQNPTTYKFSGNSDTALDALVKKLKSPENNFKDLLPTGLLDVLKAKSQAVTHRSSVMEMYRGL